MRTFALILAGAATLAAGGALSARERLTGEQQLAKLLEGRVAEKPVNCINTFTTHDARVIDKTAIVYGTGNVIYVNRPRYPESLDSDDIMVTELHSSELCNLDVVHMRDRTSFFNTGFVGLEQFVPYRRVALKD